METVVSREFIVEVAKFLGKCGVVLQHDFLDGFPNVFLKCVKCQTGVINYSISLVAKEPLTLNYKIVLLDCHTRCGKGDKNCICVDKNWDWQPMINISKKL